MSELFKIVKKAIDEFNLFGLLPEAPSNEFDGESMEIAREINVNCSVESITAIICKVFSRSFNENFEIKTFLTTAGKIYEAMRVK